MHKVHHERQKRQGCLFASNIYDRNWQVQNNSKCIKNAMKGKKDKDAYLQEISMIDSATGWIEIGFMAEARADLVANQVELAR